MPFKICLLMHAGHKHGVSGINTAGMQIRNLQAWC